MRPLPKKITSETLLEGWRVEGIGNYCRDECIEGVGGICEFWGWHKFLGEMRPFLVVVYDLRVFPWWNICHGASLIHKLVSEKREVFKKMNFITRAE